MSEACKKAVRSKPEIDERGLHAGEHTRHASFIDVADQSAATLTLDQHFLQHAVLDERCAHFARRRVDQNLVRHAALLAADPIATPQRASSAAVSNSGRPTTPV